MENQTQKLKLKYTQLGRYYLIALCSIAMVIIISQVLVQQFISEQKSDSHVINLAGRQRMLSQKITKCALLLGSSMDEDRRGEWLGELEAALAEWTHTHQLLQGDATLGNDKGQPSKAVSELFSNVHKTQAQINRAAEALVEDLRNDIRLPSDSLAAEIRTIRLAEGEFLRGMDQIVFQLEQETKDKVVYLQNIALFLMLVCLAVILFEILFVFLPSARSIKATIEKLSESGQKSEAMAMELAALYASLEEAYQDLVAVDVVPEDFTVFVKCDNKGNIIYTSEQFSQLMAFGDGQPDNLFDWLNGQGYDLEYLQKIEAMVSGGASWNGDIKVVNEEGDFVWLKLNIVPTLNEREEVESLMVIGSDETEKKEAEAISREINRER